MSRRARLAPERAVLLQAYSLPGAQPTPCRAAEGRSRLKAPSSTRRDAARGGSRSLSPIQSIPPRRPERQRPGQRRRRRAGLPGCFLPPGAGPRRSRPVLAPRRRHGQSFTASPHRLGRPPSPAPLSATGSHPSPPAVTAAPQSPHAAAPQGHGQPPSQLPLTAAPHGPGGSPSQPPLTAGTYARSRSQSPRRRGRAPPRRWTRSAWAPHRS